MEFSRRTTPRALWRKEIEHNHYENNKEMGIKARCKIALWSGGNIVMERK